MAGTFCIRLCGDDAVAYLDPAGVPAHGTPEQAAAAVGGRRVVVLAPAAQVLLTAARVPARKRQRMLQALPYALEEQLADDVELLHFAPARPGPDGRVPTAVVARERMDGWLGALREAGVQPAAMLPEQLVLPWEAGEWTLLLEPEGALLRSGAAEGWAASGDAVPALLELALVQAEERPQRLRLFLAAGADEAPVAAVAGRHALELECERLTAGALPLLAGEAGRGVALDLLQGDYGRREQLGKLWRPWRAAAALLAVLLLLEGGLALQRQGELNGRLQRLDAEVEQIYREAFPDARRVVNARVQMEQALERLRGGGSDPFVELMASAGPVLAVTRGLEVRALRYRENELEVDLSLGDFQALDALKQALAEAGPLQVDINTASAQGERVETRLRITRRGA